MAATLASKRNSGGHDGLFGTAIYAILLCSVFFLAGGLAVAAATAACVAAWWLLLRGAGTQGIDVRPNWLAVALVAALTVRFAVPPYGEAGFHGVGATRVALLVGLYGVVLCAYRQVSFARLLWILAITGTLSAALGLAAFLHASEHAERVSLLGRAAHPIMGAGAAATALVAVIVLLRHYSRHHRAAQVALACMGAVLIAAIYLSGSRGPIISLMLAVMFAALTMPGISGPRLFASGLAAWASLTLLAMFDGSIKEALCSVTSLACRPSHRPEAWAATLQLITEHPLLGVGYRFRFADAVPHAHNAYLGLALHFGIPVLGLFLAFMATCARDAARIADAGESLFVVLLYVFANGFMGTDLSEPFRFLNAHYLFLWLPLFVAIVARKRVNPPVSRPKLPQRSLETRSPGLRPRPPARRPLPWRHPGRD
jgi:O-antigen ligase